MVSPSGGRIEFAQKGGRINTDFIDNSAGVDCSDHEVNIKILLDAVVDAGDMTGKQRDQLLASMTDEVADLVLRNNVLQVQAISLAEARPQELLDSQAGFMRRLEANGKLNRELELLPDEETLGRRRQLSQGLFRPEVAVLVAYAKMTLYDELLASDLPDEPYLLQDLVKYFPRPLRKRFHSEIEGHRLRREISATLAANSLVNRGLGEFVSELSERSGRSAAQITRAYIVARDAFALVPLLGQLELLAGRIEAERQIALLGETRQALARGIQWFLRNLVDPIDIRAAVDRFAPGIASLLERLEDVLGDDDRGDLLGAIEQYVALGIDDASARRFAALRYLTPACEIVAVAEEVGIRPLAVAKVYFALDACLRLGELRALLHGARPRSHWDRLAHAGLYDDLFEQHRRLAEQALTRGKIRPAAKDAAAGTMQQTTSWLASEVTGFQRWQQLVAELDSQPSVDLAMLSVVVRSLGSLEASDAAEAA